MWKVIQSFQFSFLLLSFVCKLFHVHRTNGLKFMLFLFFFFKTQEIEIHTQSLPLLHRCLFPKPEILYSQHCNDVVPKPHFEFAFFSGGIGIFKATLYIWDPLKYSVSRWWHLGSIKFWEEDSVFYVNGYWSESSGKLCMFGSGNNYSKVILKLNYSKNNTIYGSLIDGTLNRLW